MLQAYPTQKGTGVILFGDYSDLSLLYGTVHKVASTLNENDSQTKGQFQLLMNFAYEIRKAKQGAREVEKFNLNGEEISYYGFKEVWVDILAFVCSLRSLAGYIMLDKLEQSMLYTLEYVLEKALFDYDPQGAEKAKSLLNGRLSVNQKYIFQLYQTLHKDFVSSTSGKKRFRSIYDLMISYYNPLSSKHKSIIEDFRRSASHYNCDITELEVSEFPDIVW